MKSGLMACACGILALALGGCGSMTVAGRVTPGPASVAVVVPENDARLESSGVGGAKVRVIDEGGVEVGKAVADANGRFRISMNARSAPAGPTTVEATAPGYVTAKSPIYLPRDERKVLVTLEPLGSGGGGTR